MHRQADLEQRELHDLLRFQRRRLLGARHQLGLGEGQPDEAYGLESDPELSDGRQRHELQRTRPYMVRQTPFVSHACIKND